MSEVGILAEVRGSQSLNASDAFEAGGIENFACPALKTEPAFHFGSSFFGRIARSSRGFFWSTAILSSVNVVFSSRLVARLQFLSQEM